MVKIIGTSHVSPESVDNVENEINKKEPDVVGVEIDEKRYSRLSNDDGVDTEEFDKLKRDILTGSSFFLFFKISVNFFQNIIGKNTGSRPGLEMKKAIEFSRQNNIDYKFIDRDINITFDRVFKNLTLKTKIKIFFMLTFGFLYYVYRRITFREVSIFNIDYEKLKKDPNGEEAGESMEGLKDSFPDIYEVIIDERDRLMAKEVKKLEEEYNKVAIVVGAGHKKGIKNYLEKSYIPDIKELKSSVFSLSNIVKILWLVSTLLIFATFFSLYFTSMSILNVLTIILFWVGVTSIPTFLINYKIGNEFKYSIMACFLSTLPTLFTNKIFNYIVFKFGNISRRDLRDMNNIVYDPPSKSMDKNYEELVKNPIYRLLVLNISSSLGNIVGIILFVLIILPFVLLT